MAAPSDAVLSTPVLVCSLTDVMVEDIEELDLRNGHKVMARILAMDKISLPHRARVRRMDNDEELIALMIDVQPPSREARDSVQDSTLSTGPVSGSEASPAHGPAKRGLQSWLSGKLARLWELAPMLAASMAPAHADSRPGDIEAGNPAAAAEKDSKLPGNSLPHTGSTTPLLAPPSGGG
eukprot:CAMPEP_0178385076 /NCGR_PEP_ID=MMETSP0689_2-20121128/7847_1 /TAXON_ID=160604 /ORGANISM="Amphidinium massartii, Strain CS-259" /LENGTH=179 /DNA_ID=CAMNT_0020005349 /DNA_START=35 /DNA_END=571 /DNA_ORIENTATION=-